MNKERNIYIDVVKGIGIISIVLGHAFNTDYFSNYGVDYIRRFVYCFHIVIFFWCAGFLFKTFNPHSNILYSVVKWYRKFVAVCLLSFLMLPIWYYFNVVEFIPAKIIVKKVINILMFKQDGILTGALWFVPFYCITQVLFYLIQFCCKKISNQFQWKCNIKIEIIICFFMGLLGVLLVKIHKFGFYSFNLSLVMLPIIEFGKYSRLNWEKLKQFCGKKMIFLSGGSILLLNYITSGEIELSKGKIYYGIGFYPISIFGVLFCISFMCWSVDKNKYTIIQKFLGNCGKNSFVIMTTHFMVFKFLDGIIGVLSNKDYVKLKLYPISYENLRILYFLLGVIIPILIVHIYKKFYEILQKISMYSEGGGRNT